MKCNDSVPNEFGVGGVESRQHARCFRACRLQPRKLSQQRSSSRSVGARKRLCHRQQRIICRTKIRTLAQHGQQRFANLRQHLFDSRRRAHASSVARGDGSRSEVDPLRDRLAHPALPELFGKLGFDDEFSVLGSAIAGPAALTRFASNAPANTDDHPVVTYTAPRITYELESLPRDRLIALLHELSDSPSELLVPSADLAFPPRLASYWAARNHFIESGERETGECCELSQHARGLMPEPERALLGPNYLIAQGGEARRHHHRAGPPAALSVAWVVQPLNRMR